MTATYDEATDTIFSQFYNLWVQQAAMVAGYVPTVYWPSIEEPKVKPADVFWARLTRQTVIQKQASLANNNGVRRYTTTGLVSVQVFAPMLAVGAATKCVNLAKLAQDAYRGTTTANGIWFRNCTIKELPADGTFYRCNVVSDFTYDEIS
jgi:hypothetical protein